MTINISDSPVPTGAVCGMWSDSDFPEDVHRCLTWARFDAAGVIVAVQGTQDGRGQVRSYVLLCAEAGDAELTAAAARQVAAALLNAADIADKLQ